MVRVSTFCPRCGETIETEVPEEARHVGRAELECPSCRFGFVIAPARAADGAPAGLPDTSRGANRGPSTPTPRAEAAVTYPQITAPTRRPPSFKPLAAGMMLLFAALIGLWIAATLVLTDDVVRTTFADFDGDAPFEGTVVDGRGRGIADVNVSYLEADQETVLATTTTGPDGTYAFDAVQAGIRWFRYEKAGYETVLYEAPVYPPGAAGTFGDRALLGRVTLDPGQPDTVTTKSLVEDIEFWFTILGWVVLVASLLAIAGGIAALRRRGFPLAVVGAVAGIFTIGFIVGAVVSVIALVLILFSRREFRPLRTKRAPPEGRAS